MRLRARRTPLCPCPLRSLHSPRLPALRSLRGQVIPPSSPPVIPSRARFYGSSRVPSPLLSARRRRRAPVLTSGVALLRRRRSAELVVPALRMSGAALRRALPQRTAPTMTGAASRVLLPYPPKPCSPRIHSRCSAPRRSQPTSRAQRPRASSPCWTARTPAASTVPPRRAAPLHQLGHLHRRHPPEPPAAKPPRLLCPLLHRRRVFRRVKRSAS
mmetsp:Transcript_42850/g.108179  ORF Transcript_42850/g.108179 Transcript_42850/m.108179 type:complete len:215 (+) Transcript_42850:794-1438(+)